MRATRIAAILGWISLSFAVAAQAATAETLTWQPNLDVAKQMAKQHNRMVLVHFGAPWCEPCTVLERDVFSRPEIKLAIESHFIPVKLNADESGALTSMYDIRKLPSDVILSPNGEVIGKFNSPLNGDQYLLELCKSSGLPVTAVASYLKDPGIVTALNGPTQWGPDSNPYAAAAANHPPAAGTSPFVQNAANHAPATSHNPYMTTPYTMPAASQPTGVPQGGFNAGVNQQPNTALMPNHPQVNYAERSSPLGKPASPSSMFQPPNQYLATGGTVGGIASPSQQAINPMASTYPAMGVSQPLMQPANQPIAQTIEPSATAGGFAGSPSGHTIAPAIGTPAMGSPIVGATVGVPPAVEPAAGGSPALNSTPSVGSSMAGGFGGPVGPANVGAIAPAASIAATGGMPDPAIAPADPYAPQPPITMVPLRQVPGVGLDGCCPITLVEKMKYAKGQPKFGAVHRGQTYLFASEANQQKFLANPDRYSPVMSGNDPVMAFDTGQYIPGARAYGVFYQNRIYLFANPETKMQFQKMPGKYATEVLQAEAVGRGQLR
ncbi:MAG: thioredoxin family protein [Planctomycetota bacterium]|nr:thioredoxin family protein [Planctomycetota bacterium]